MKKTKTELLTMIAGIFVGCLIISNVLASKTFVLGDVVLPCAVIIFPIVYIVNDLLAEIYGFNTAKKVILLGFGVNLLAVVAYTIAITLPAPIFAQDGAVAFETVLGSSWRILLGSFTAYLIGSLLNAHVMVRLKEHLNDKLMLRCITSTLVGEGVDAMIFITIAFIGTMPFPDLLIMIVAQATFKTLFEVVFYPVTRVVIHKAEALMD